jgi:hypothetical protein
MTLVGTHARPEIFVTCELSLSSLLPVPLCAFTSLTPRDQVISSRHLIIHLPFPGCFRISLPFLSPVDFDGLDGACPFDGVLTVISPVEVRQISSRFSPPGRDFLVLVEIVYQVRNGNPVQPVTPSYATRTINWHNHANLTSFVSHSPKNTYDFDLVQPHHHHPPLRTSYRKSVKSAAVIVTNHIPACTPPPLPRDEITSHPHPSNLYCLVLQCILPFSNYLMLTS